MESLPGEMIVVIGRCLSVADLAACSATCRTWREKFNDDRIWRRRCTLRLVEYLENTDTTVPPGLQLTEHDSLSPLCEWRIRFIRENYLWNNWRVGNVKVHKITTEQHANTMVQFYGNEYIIMIFNCEVKLWDVRDVPTCLMTNPCELDTTLIIDYFEILSENRILIVQSSIVSVFSMSVTSTHWPLIHTFCFNERLSTSRFNDSTIRSPLPREDGIIPEKHFYIVNGDYFLGVAPDYTKLLHVWNVRTGNKLKEVLCPIRSPTSFFTRLYRSRKPSPDVLLAINEYQRDESSLRIWTHLYVYNVIELTLRDFTHTRVARGIRSSRSFTFKIHDPYVFIKDPSYLHIHNYKTSTLIDIQPAISNPVVFNENVIYVESEKFVEFNVTTEMTSDLSIFEPLDVFFIACDRFISQTSNLVDFELLEVGRRQARSKYVIEENNRHWLSHKRAKHKCHEHKKDPYGIR
ncbi:uncharacterized protein LOC124358899 isoform X4 [Homalodisca vitripennis]|uniref:uncharacterized protein LOC124358899 isoform X4 n=1 Tax=Homalodisca vitripennis TaxID=197043 RepID=UPI001EECF399|nr:uncharacterized protein LOC124358899 isoform X4 [Homalodisca vitripennis]